MNTHPVLLKLARQGDPRAIAALMNDALREQDIWVKATRNDRSLQVMLKAPRALNQSTCVAFLRWGMARLQSVTIDHIYLYAWQTYGDFPDWVTDFSLEQPEPRPTESETIEVAVSAATPTTVSGTVPRIDPTVSAASAAKVAAPDVALADISLVRPSQPAKAVKFGVVVVVALMLYFVVASV